MTIEYYVYCSIKSLVYIFVVNMCQANYAFMF